MHQNKYRIAVIVGYTLAVFLLVFALFRFKTPETLLYAEAEGGVLDLRGFDFSRNIAAQQTIEVFPGELLTPDALEGRTGQMVETLPRAERLTTRTRLLVPDDHPYTIFFTSASTASRVYIGGALADTLGTMGVDADSTVPQVAFCHYTVWPVDGVVDIVQTAVNYHQYETTGHKINIGLPAVADSYLRNVQFFDDLVMATLLVAALIHFGYFLFFPALRSNLYFSLFCFSFFVRAGLTDHLLWSAVYPGLGWVVLFRAGYLSICFCGVFFLLFTRHFFAGALPRVLSGGFLALFLAGTLPALGLSTYTLSRVFPAVFAVVLTGLLAALCFLMRRVRKNDYEQNVSLGGLTILFVCVVLDNLCVFGLLPPHWEVFHVNYTNFGMTVYVMAQMMSLFLRSNREINTTRMNARRLSAENQMLDRVNGMKTNFLANVSHEFKTPLTVVSNYAQLILRHANARQDAYTAEKIRLVDAEAHRMTLMVGQLLEIARVEETGFTLHTGPVDLKALVEAAVEQYFPMLNKNRNTLQLQLSETLPTLTADADRVTQVVVNLLSNAQRFTRHGVITVAAARVGDMVEVSVSDTGAGMGPDELAHIFDRYYTNDDQSTERTPGTGLGLYICRFIVEAHGGTIHAQSTPGQGSRMSFTLPVL